MSILKTVLNARKQSSSKASSASKRSLKDLPSDILVPRMLVIGAAFLLVCIGLVMIFSASSIVTITKFDNPFYYIQRQLVYVMAGLIACVIASKLNYRRYSILLCWIFWAITLIALAYVAFSSKGAQALGAKRWLMIFGFTFQPTEFAKITILLLMSSALASFHERRIDSRTLIIITLVGVALPLGLIITQPDLGSCIIIVVTLICLIWLMGLPLRYLLYTFGTVALVVSIFVLTSEFRRNRLIATFNPWLDAQGAGYQQVQGIYALASGGIFGLGLGNSRQKFSYLPEAHTDFIFAIIGEELGLIGALIIIILFVALIFGGLQIARKAPDMMGKLIACGATSCIAIQAGINLFCVVGFFPVTGKPLPFLSYGGSSIITSLIFVGLLLNVSIMTGKTAHLGRTRKEQRKSERAQRRRASFTIVD